MRRLLLASPLLMLLCASAHGQATATTCSQTDVQNAITTATVGQTVNVPAGNCTWTGIILNKGITLNGSGNTASIITMPNAQSLLVTKQPNNVTRIQNFKFITTFNNPGSGPTGNPIVIQGTWPSGQPVIFQNNAFDATVGTEPVGIVVAGGVIFSHNSFIGTWASGWLTVKDLINSSSWTTSDSLGTRDTNGLLNIYIEDNNLIGGSAGGNMDCDDNCRVVWRHNTIGFNGQDGGGFNSHGWDSSPFGMRQFEIYNNAFNFPDQTCNNGNSSLSNIQQWIWIRGGSGVIYNNTMVHLSSQCWGTKSEVRLSNRGAEDDRPQGTCASTHYPVPHQLGQNNNGTSDFTDPIWFWGNTGTSTVITGSWTDFGGGANPCNFDWNTFWQWGRDGQNTSYTLPITLPFGGGSTALPGGTPKPGYTAFTYPHPLVSGGGPTIPSAPANLTLVASGSNANLSWTAPPQAITGYHVYRGTVHGGPYSLISSPTSPSFVDTPGTGTFFWVVTAFNSAGESVKSNEVTTTLPVTLTVSFAPTSLTFASFTVGSPSPTQTVTVTNTSAPSASVTFSGITFAGTNPGDFSRTTTCTTLATAGQQCTATVTFTPTAPGARSALLTFTDNATGSPQTVAVSGTGVAATPIAQLAPASHDFGQQAVSTTSTAFAFTLTNSGTGPLTVSSITPSGDFAVSSTVPASTCGGSVAPGGSCLINVTFTPTVSGGRSGSISVVDNAAGSPHVASVTGTGTTTKCQMTGATTLSGPAVVCGP